MWLRYPPIEDQAYRAACLKVITGIVVSGHSSLIDSTRRELDIGLSSLMGELPRGRAGLEVKTKHPLIPAADLEELGDEGFFIKSLAEEGQQPKTIITANSDRGLLYGTHAFLRMVQLRKPLQSLAVKESPRIKLRMLNHWDNPFRGDVVRGYAGPAIFSWEHMGDSRQEAYARFLASVGVNGTVINSVNTSVANGWRVIDENRLMELRPWQPSWSVMVFNFTWPLISTAPSSSEISTRRIHSIPKYRIGGTRELISSSTTSPTSAVS